MSILFQMYLRVVISGLYLVTTFLINTRLFYIGKISDLGMKNGLIFFILFSVQIILLVVLTEGTNLYCDPVNVRNRGKYVGIFLVQLFMMGFPYILWKTSVISGNRQRIFAVLFGGMAIVVLGTHMQIIESYKKVTDEEVQELIAGYTMQWNEDLAEKSYEIRKKHIAL